MLDSRHAFQRSSLTDAQRLTYDVVEDYLEFTRLTDDYYYLDNSCRGSFTGFWAQLPILLNEFKFNRRSDLGSCFHIPETAEETFLGYAEIERERLENEAGLSQVTLDDIIAHERSRAARDPLYHDVSRVFGGPGHLREEFFRALCAGRKRVRAALSDRPADRADVHQPSGDRRPVRRLKNRSFFPITQSYANGHSGLAG